MDGSLLAGLAPVTKRVAPYVLAVAVGGGGVGYAVHENRDAQTQNQQAQSLAAQNAQMTAQLNATNTQMNVLAAKVNNLETSSAAKPSPAARAGETAGVRGTRARRAGMKDSRFDKLQSQVDAQGKEIAQTQSDLAGTRNDLSSTRTELTGSIAKTHDELVVLEKKGQRNYFEFDLQKSKAFKREGPMSISLRKANEKHQYADLTLLVDDRNVTQKHVNLYQPVMYYQPGTEQPMEVVINDISKDHIHGYISAPKYQPSELAAMTADATGGQANGNAQPAQRQKLTLSSSDMSDAGPVEVGTSGAGTSSQPAANPPNAAQPNQQ
jgi:hypothetical protein